MIRLLLADDQPLFREGLASLLSLEKDLEVVGEANDGMEAIALTEELQPDIILMDVRMPVCDGVKATREIHRRFPWIRILVLTTFDEDEYVRESLRGGALGYILKSTSSIEVGQAIRSLYQGYSQLGPTIAPKVFAQLGSSPPVEATDYHHLLGDRELTILKLLGRGKNNREIAIELHLSLGTVKNYITQILSKLELRDRTQAALWAHEHLLSS